MNIKTDYESPLVLKNIIITEGHFKRNEDSLENLELLKKNFALFLYKIKS